MSRVASRCWVGARIEGMTNDPAAFYLRAAQANPLPEGRGASGYFSRPEETLDPNLFDGDQMKPAVREHILAAFFAWAEQHHLRSAEWWLHAWIAGSAVTYQWSADRGNGDIDVLFTVDLGKFAKANPEFNILGGSNSLAEQLNESMYSSLWPGTSLTTFGNRVYEVTYYDAPGLNTAEHAYAAYDLTDDRWSIRPPVLPADPKGLYPQAWYDRADSDRSTAAGLSERYKASVAALGATTPGSPEWLNSGSELGLVMAHAHSLLDDIHLGRAEAFTDRGRGYGDWHNFRWQAAKQSGAVDALRAISAAHEAARQDQETLLYGKPLEGSQALLIRAAAMHGNRP